MKTDEQINKEHAERGIAIIEAHAKEAGNQNEDTETKLGDLLADLMHAAGTGVFDEALRRARNHYADETGDTE